MSGVLKLTLVRCEIIKTSQKYNQDRFAGSKSKMDSKDKTGISEGYTKGKLFINGNYECDIREDRDWFHEESDDKFSKKIKNKHQRDICVQTGVYPITFHRSNVFKADGSYHHHRPNMTVDEERDYINKMYQITVEDTGQSTDDKRALMAYLGTDATIDGWKYCMFHLGVNELNTIGCILVGKDEIWEKKNCKISEFYPYFEHFYKQIWAAHKRDESIELTITYDQTLLNNISANNSNTSSKKDNLVVTEDGRVARRC